MSCAKSELCIFNSAMPQVVVENGAFETIFPTTTIHKKGECDVEFNIVGSNTEYLDLNDTLLFVEINVVDSKGNDLELNADVVPTNYLFHSLFKDAVLYLNGVKIEGGNTIYHHKSLLETIINYNNDTKKTSLTSIGYDPIAENRKKWIAGSKSFQMCGSLQLDFFDQPKYLIPGVNVRLVLSRNNPNFCVSNSKISPTVIISQARLYIRRVRVEPSVLIGHQIGLNTQNAIYPYRRSKLISYTLAAGSNGFYKDQLFGDMRLPKFVLITFLTNDQYFGNYGEQTISYKHLNVTDLTLTRSNDFRESYIQDFENDNYVTTYVTSLIRNLGHLDKSLNAGITMKDFKELYPFFTFVLAPDFDVFQTQLPKQGNLKLDIKFGTALKTAASLLIYGIFDSEIQINKNGTVIV